jgi:hypothetical protein
MRAYHVTNSGLLESILKDGLIPKRKLLRDEYRALGLPDWAFNLYVFAFVGKPDVVHGPNNTKSLVFNSNTSGLLFAYVMPPQNDTVLEFELKDSDEVLVVDEYIFPDMSDRAPDDKPKLAKRYVAKACPAAVCDYSKYIIPAFAFKNKIEPDRLAVDRL